MAENDNPGTTGSAERAREDSDGGVVTARERFQRLSEDVQGRYQKVSDDVKRGAERARSEIRRGAEAAREGYDTVRQNAGDWSRDLNYYVRDNPGKSVLIAVGVGFLLGLLVRRGRDEGEEG